MRRPRGKVTSQGRISSGGNLRLEATRRRVEMITTKNRARPSEANIWREERKRGDWEGRQRKSVEQRDAKKRPTAPWSLWRWWGVARRKQTGRRMERERRGRGVEGSWSEKEKEEVRTKRGRKRSRIAPSPEASRQNLLAALSAISPQSFCSSQADTILIAPQSLPFFK